MKPAGAVLALLALFAVAALAAASIGPVSAAPASHSSGVFSMQAGWDCVTKDGDFCAGEMASRNGQPCVTSTTCTDAQLAECLPGIKRCSEVVSDPAGPAGQAGD